MMIIVLEVVNPNKLRHKKPTTGTKHESVKSKQQHACVLQLQVDKNRYL
jgi:ubiquitin